MNPIDENKKLNLTGQELFYRYIDEVDKLKRKNIKDKLIVFIKENHNKQWSKYIHNILSVKSNCRNDCKYCYMKQLKNKFHNVDLENFDIILDNERVTKRWQKTHNHKMIMFPSSHDILYDYVDSFIQSALNILNAGHSLLIVTKPNINSITKMIQSFFNYKNKILFRLTITSKNDEILSFYEPNAPKYDERKECIINLYEEGYKTSLSMEPFLDDPIIVINDLRQYVTDDIWIGTMSGINSNISIDDQHKEQLNEIYTKNNLMKLVKKLKHDEKIMWKTSIMKVILR